MLSDIFVAKNIVVWASLSLLAGLLSHPARWIFRRLDSAQGPVAILYSSAALHETTTGPSVHAEWTVLAAFAGDRDWGDNHNVADKCVKSAPVSESRQQPRPRQSVDRFVAAGDARVRCADAGNIATARLGCRDGNAVPAGVRRYRDAGLWR